MLQHEKIDAFRAKYNDIAYMVFRVLVGLFFIAHGMQKIFGLFTDKGAQPFLGGGMTAAGVNLLWVAGIVEFLGGLLIILGLFTSIAALISAVTMLFAYFMAHAPRGALPVANGGELALLHFAAFIYIVFAGGGTYSLDAKMCKKKQ